jgi:transposase-like protein
VAVRVPGCGPVRAGHRRFRIRPAGCQSGSPVLRRALGSTKVTPVEVVTDKAAVYPRVLDELAPSAWHRTDRYANNSIEADHRTVETKTAADARFEDRRRRQSDHAGHAFVQNARRGHYELDVDEPIQRRVASAFAELAEAI